MLVKSFSFPRLPVADYSLALVEKSKQIVTLEPTATSPVEKDCSHEQGKQLNIPRALYHKRLTDMKWHQTCRVNHLLADHLAYICGHLR